MKPDHKIVVFLLALMLFTGIPAAYVPASPDNTIYVNSLQDLIKLANDCSLDTYSQGKIVQLNRDLNVSNSNFVSIPTFGGTFNGNGHTISGLKITKSGSAQGLFRYIQQDGQVLDLNVSGIVKTSGSKQNRCCTSSADLLLACCIHTS